MTSKHQNQMSRRYPLKRVRPDNENQSSALKTNGRFSKKFCREPSEGFSSSFTFVNRVFLLI